MPGGRIRSIAGAFCNVVVADDPIPNDAGTIHLKVDEHFYSAQVTLNPGVS